MRLIMYWLLATFVFWFLYATLMRVIAYRLKLKKGTWQYVATTVVGGLVAIVGYPYDVAYNFTFGSLIFWEWPQRVNGKFEWTFTDRLQRTIFRPDWRGKVAKFFCRYLVEPWDENHCGTKVPK